MARILVVEDNAINLELITFLLHSFGHTTLCAADGSSGLALARRERPDLVLCDIQMPGLDGHAVARALRADPQLRAVPLVAVTAAAMVGDRERALGAGFDAHVSKPIDPAALVALVDSLVPAPAAPQASADAMPSGRPVGQVPPALLAPRPGLRLLMVDDKLQHLEFKRDLLGPAGYEVLGLTGGDEAWALLQHTPVDLVLSDVVMPGMDGFALLARVRNDSRLARLPFAFLTSTACDQASERQGLALGADAYLRRPIDPQALLRAVRGLLDVPARG